MRLADSSYLLALFLSGDRNHSTAWEETARADPIMVISEVLSETLGVLQKRKGIDFARMAKEWLESKPHVQFAFTLRQHFDVASRVFAKAPERVNYVDAVLVAWVLDTGARLLTFDADLQRAARRAS